MVTTSSHARSPESDYSILSSLDALSLSTADSRRPSTASNPSARSSSAEYTDGFEVVLIPQTSEASSSSSSGQGKGASKSAKRRERLRKLQEKRRDSEESGASCAEKAMGQEGGGKKTRRGGTRVRIRREKAQVRNMLQADDLVGVAEPPTPPPPAARPQPALSGSSSWRQAVDSSSDSEEDSEAGASRYLDIDEEDEEDEVDGLSALDEGESIPGYTWPSSVGNGRRVLEGSVMSTEDARSSIDSFLRDADGFTRDKANKLRLWQSLCIELGLVQLDTGPTAPSPPSDPHTPRSSRSSTPTPTASRSATPQPALPPLPQSLSQARHILKQSGHVNIPDFLAARADPADAGRSTGQYGHLVYPSQTAMKRYTRENKKLAALSEVKMEWLEPLLRDFGFKRSRATRTP